MLTCTTNILWLPSRPERCPATDGLHGVLQVPWQAIEEAFWNIVEEGEEEVEVLYGADLDSTIFGSAFPTRTGRMQDSKYAESPWNLNNLPRLPGGASSQLADSSLQLV